MRSVIRKLFLKLDRKIYKDKKFVVIANNCWGGEVYKRLNTEFNTPFIGLYIYGPDYVKLLENMDYYFSQELNFSEGSKWTATPLKYPVGKLDDIEIHFMHYKDNAEAKQKWERRVQRLQQVQDKDQFYIKICDRDHGDAETLKRFHALPYKNKISFAIFSLSNKSHVKVKENDDNVHVPDGVSLYKISHKYLDPLKWVGSGKFGSNLYSSLKYYLYRYKVL